VKALLFNGEIRVDEVPLPPIYKDHVLVEVIAGVSNGIENAIYKGYLWINPGTILGCEGVGKVKHVGVDVEHDLIGKTVVPKYDNILKIPGIHIHGFLAEFIALPVKSIEVIGDNTDVKLAALARSISIAVEVAERASNSKLLIMGSGFTGKLASLLASKSALEVYVLSEKPIQELKDHVTSIIKPSSKVIYNYKWDIVFISSLNPMYQLIVQKGVNVEELFIHPLIVAAGETIKPGRYKVEVAKGVDAPRAVNKAKEYSWFIEKNASLVTSLDLAVPSIKPKTIWLRKLKS